jgi:hypothetical protein
MISHAISTARPTTRPHALRPPAARYSAALRAAELFLEPAAEAARGPHGSHVPVPVVERVASVNGADRHEAACHGAARFAAQRHAGKRRERLQDRAAVQIELLLQNRERRLRAIAAVFECVGGGVSEGPVLWRHRRFSFLARTRRLGCRLLCHRARRPTNGARITGPAVSGSRPPLILRQAQDERVGRRLARPEPTKGEPRTSLALSLSKGELRTSLALSLSKGEHGEGAGKRASELRAKHIARPGPVEGRARLKARTRVPVARKHTSLALSLSKGAHG